MLDASTPIATQQIRSNCKLLRLHAGLLSLSSLLLLRSAAVLRRDVCRRKCIIVTIHTWHCEPPPGVLSKKASIPLNRVANRDGERLAAPRRPSGARCVEGRRVPT
jgi:hypothetical protein